MLQVHQIILEVFFCGVLKSYIKIVLNVLSQNPDINSYSNSAKLVLVEIIRWQKLIPNWDLQSKT